MQIRRYFSSAILCAYIVLVNDTGKTESFRWKNHPIRREMETSGNRFQFSFQEITSPEYALSRDIKVNRNNLRHSLIALTFSCCNPGHLQFAPVYFPVTMWEFV